MCIFAQNGAPYKCSYGDNYREQRERELQTALRPFRPIGAHQCSVYTHSSGTQFLRQSGSRSKSLKEQLVPGEGPRSLRNSSLCYSILPSRLAVPKSSKHCTWPSTMTCLGQQWTQRGQTASTLLPMAGELTCYWQTTRPTSPMGTTFSPWTKGVWC